MFLRRSIVLALAALIGPACLPGLDFEVIGEGRPDIGRRDGGLDGGVDADLPDGPGRDVPLPSEACDPPVTCEDGCPMPWLLAAVEDLPGAEDCGDRVWRWSLARSLEFCACTGYAARTTATSAVGFVPPNLIVTGGTDGVVGFEADSGAVRWSRPVGSGERPRSIFAVQEPSGPMRAGVGLTRTSTEIRQVLLVDAADGGMVISRATNGDFPGGLGLLSMTQSSHNANFVRTIKTGTATAFDLDGWTDTTVTPDYVETQSGYNVQRIHSYYYDRFHRTAWTGTRSDLSGSPSQVWHLSVATDAYEQSLVGQGATCVTNRDTSLPYDRECEFVGAVADPESTSGAYAICKDPTSTRSRVVLESLDACQDLIETDDVLAGGRVVSLAVAAPSLWRP